MPDRKIVLTADRTLNTNFRHNYLFGFLSCGPSEKIPNFVHKYLMCPTEKADKNTGEVRVAQCGLRRVESGLLEKFSREEVIIAHPDYLEKAVSQGTKVVGINAMDPLGMGPVSTALTSNNNTPFNKKEFTILTNEVKSLKRRYDFKVVIGGSGAWQFKEKDKREQYGIDHVVKGELDNRAAEIFNKIIDGSAEEFIRIPTFTIDDIPMIRGPTINGMTECMRGCGRGCNFCDPNLRKKRDIPADRVIKECEINAKYGYSGIWLHSDEFLLYGCDNKDFYPNRDAILELVSGVLNIKGVDIMGATHWAFASTRADPELIKRMGKLNRTSPDRWMSVQIGLETGSSRTVQRIMPGKAKPYAPNEWQETTIEAMKILNENYYYPACTLIVGEPGEDADDFNDTIELIDVLSTTECILAPLLYVDYYGDKSVTFNNMTQKQWEIYRKCWLHNLRQINDKIALATKHFNPVVRGATMFLTRIGTKYILNFLRKNVNKGLPDKDRVVEKKPEPPVPVSVLNN